MKVALVHDWLIHMRGGEKVLEAIAELFPQATIYTLFHDRKKLSPTLQQMKIQSSFLQYVPGIKKIYRWLLPILPLAIRSIRIQEADLVISSVSHPSNRKKQVRPCLRRCDGLCQSAILKKYFMICPTNYRHKPCFKFYLTGTTVKLLYLS